MLIGCFSWLEIKLVSTLLVNSSSVSLYLKSIAPIQSSISFILYYDLIPNGLENEVLSLWLQFASTLL